MRLSEDTEEKCKNKLRDIKDTYELCMKEGRKKVRFTLILVNFSRRNSIKIYIGQGRVIVRIRGNGQRLRIYCVLQGDTEAEGRCGEIDKEQDE